MPASPAPAVYDHYRTAGDTDRTVYRVVGVGDDRVTLLRLTDDAGAREATGELRYIARTELDDEFERADDPDPRFGFPDYLGGLFVLAGVVMVVYPETDLVAGIIMLGGGLFILVRRGHLNR